MRHPLLLICQGLLALAGAAANAQPLQVQGEGACPAVDVVVARLRAMLRAREVVAGPRADALVVRHWDSGARYGVEVGPTRRELEDPARLCEDRARAVALIVALAVEPPTVAAATRPPPAPPRRWLVTLDIASILDAAPAAGGQSDHFAFGGTLRVALGIPIIRAVLGVSALSPTTLDLGTARARILRVPLDVGVRLANTWTRAELSGDLGLAATVLSATGEALVPSRTETRLELGVRTALRLAFPLGGRWAPFVAVQALVAPSPFSIEATPVGSIGATPRVYVAGLLGAAVRLD